MPRVAIAVEKRDQVDDAELIARVLAGDRVAGRMLYEAHAPRVHRLIYRLTGEAELTRELTQDAFVRAFGQLSKFRGDAAFSTWMHRIAVTVTSNGLRKVRRLRARETPLDDLLPRAGKSTFGDPDLRARLERAIDALPEACRITLVMHDIEGYTHVEIAAATGVAEGTSKSRLFDARARLRAALADFAKE